MPKKRAVLYARVSGDDRQNEARNLTSQIEMCRAYAQQRGYEIVAELTEDDRGASGAAFELPQLNRARELAQAGAYDVLVAREIDRLSRRLAKQLFVEDELQRNEVNIEYALAEYAPTPEGGFMKNIRASFAEYERLKITERMVRGRRQKVAAGSVLVCNNPPYGYRSVQVGRDWRLEIEPEEAEVVREVFAWYVAGASMAAIQVRLSENRVPSAFDKRPSRAGQKKREHGVWSRASVHNILTNETYRGVWSFGKGSSNGSSPSGAPRPCLQVRVPAIVSDETWELVQQRIATNTDMSPRSTKRPYLLRRRVYCGACGAKLRACYSGPPDRPYLYYRCPATAQHKYSYGCDLPSFPAAVVDDQVWAWLRLLLLEPAVLESGLRTLANKRQTEQAPLADKIVRIDRELQQIEEEQVRLGTLFVKGLLSEEALNKLAVEIADRQTARRRERERLQRELTASALDDGEVQDLLDAARAVGEGLPAAEQDFEFRKLVVDRLDVVATLTVEEGQKWVDASLVLRQKPLAVASLNIPDSGRNKRPEIVLRRRFLL